MKFFTYMLRCRDDSLYTGYTDNLEKRLTKHNNGQWAKYTRGRTPVTLAYFESFDEKSRAMKRENEIKKFSKKQKENLVLEFQNKNNL